MVGANSIIEMECEGGLCIVRIRVGQKKMRSCFFNVQLKLLLLIGLDKENSYRKRDKRLVNSDKGSSIVHTLFLNKLNLSRV